MLSVLIKTVTEDSKSLRVGESLAKISLRCVSQDKLEEGIFLATQGYLQTQNNRSNYRLRPKISGGGPWGKWCI